ncbi:MAG: 3-oxoacyl-[acyl-carrier protein] reductase, partial [uncultured Frankineae bacterium]
GHVERSAPGRPGGGHHRSRARDRPHDRRALPGLRSAGRGGRRGGRRGHRRRARPRPPGPCRRSAGRRHRRGLGARPAGGGGLGVRRRRRGRRQRGGPAAATGARHGAGGVAARDRHQPDRDVPHLPGARRAARRAGPGRSHHRQLVVVRGARRARQRCLLGVQVRDDRPRAEPRGGAGAVRDHGQRRLPGAGRHPDAAAAVRRPRELLGALAAGGPAGPARHHPARAAGPAGGDRRRLRLPRVVAEQLRHGAVARRRRRLPGGLV